MLAFYFFLLLFLPHLAPLLLTRLLLLFTCTFRRSITFPLACLAGVFVVVLHLLLVPNHHVGTLLLSAAGLLGAVWSGIAAAGILVSYDHTCGLQRYWGISANA
jgi:hypothetical protein